MNLDFAVDRLYASGWHPLFGEIGYEELADGRRFPSLNAVQRIFESAGLQLVLKQNFTYNCFRATWAPSGEEVEATPSPDDRHGTVVGSSEAEAAVYALAQFRESSGTAQLALA